jgi:uncharacterized membrane protein YraQ (UPF0718 family)
MKIPVYAFTGSLFSGKTTLINRLLDMNKERLGKLLVIQFETGEVRVDPADINISCISFHMREIERAPEIAALRIQEEIQSAAPDMIWVEWNGMSPVSKLISILGYDALRALCVYKKSVLVADAGTLEGIIGKTGNALLEQIASSDVVYLRGSDAEMLKRTRHMLKRNGAGTHIFCGDMNDASSDAAIEAVTHTLFRAEESAAMYFAIALGGCFILYIISSMILGGSSAIYINLIDVFLGLILQGIPFLMIGVILSSAIQVFVPRSFIERRFPKSIGMGILAAVVGGFFLPVCDCASIPIFKSLIRKGVPVPAAVTFMFVTPIINPVVMLSTYNAFQTQPSMVWIRIGLGIVISTLIGCVFAFRPAFSNAIARGGSDALSSGCAADDSSEPADTLPGKILLTLRHARSEFFQVGKYLMIGVLIASVFQSVSGDIFAVFSGSAGLAASMAVMMAMAFALSLCSSSDAVVARSFANQFPPGAIMLFLVFGPMMDVKNVMMLSGGFSGRFVRRLLCASAAVSFAVVFIFYGLRGLGGGFN